MKKLFVLIVVALSVFGSINLFADDKQTGQYTPKTKDFNQAVLEMNIDDIGYYIGKIKPDNRAKLINKANIKALPRISLKNYKDATLRTSAGYLNETPLIYAIKENNFEIVKLLVENGADVNQIVSYKEFSYGIQTKNMIIDFRSSAKDEIPLNAAIRKFNMEILQYLVEHGADVNIQTKNDFTPFALAYRMKFTQGYEYLEKSNKLNDISYTNTLGTIMIDFQIYSSNKQQWKNINQQKIEALRRNGVVVDVQEDSNPIDINQLKYFISKGANLNAKVFNDINRKFTSVLILAKDNFDLVKLFIDSGADPKNGPNPLQELLFSYTNVQSENTLNVIKYLVEHGADINVPYSEHHITPLLASIGNSETFQYLVEHGAKIEGDYLFVRSIKKEGTEALKLLLKYGIKIEKNDGVLAAEKAAFYKNHEALKILLEAGIDIKSPLIKFPLKLTYWVNPKLPSYIMYPKGENLLFISVIEDDIEGASMLIKHGINVNHVNEGGLTPFDIATKNNNVKMMQMLIEAGAKEGKKK